MWIPLLRSNYTAMSEPGEGIPEACARLLTVEQVVSVVGVSDDGEKRYKLKLPGHGLVELENKSLFIVTPRILPFKPTPT